MTDSLDQMQEFMRLAAELGIEDTSSKTEFNTGVKDYAGITPYNVIPKNFYKIADYAKKGVYTFNMPYSKASTPEEERAGRNVLNTFTDSELDREFFATSFKGYAVEYNDVHEWSEYNDEKYTSHCKVIGQRIGDIVTNEPVIIPTKWMYKSGAATNHIVPSDAFIKTNSVGSNGMNCVDCIKDGFNQGLDTKGKNSWCKEKGNLIVYITHLGTVNKKTGAIVYTPVGYIFFASSWALANGKTEIIRHEFLPCYMNLSGSYIQGSFEDKVKNQEAIDGFGSFFEKIRKSCANTDFFNMVQWKMAVTIVPKDPVAALSFTSEGSYDTAELSKVITHWKESKPEFVKQEVPFNKFTTELRGNAITPTVEQVEAQQEAVKKTTDLTKF